MILLTDKLEFPPVDQAMPYGLLAIGGDLSPNRLLLAYKSGIFPWFNPDEVIQWWVPDPRFVLFPNNFRTSKSTRKILKSDYFQFTENKNFKEVITNCANVKRTGQNGTWITEEMIDAYCLLHEKGIAKSIEVWKGSELVGGFYGIDLGNIFCGESMFSKASNASKCGFSYFMLHHSYKYKLIDCQVYTEYLEQFGAQEIPRTEFMKYLQSEEVKNLDFK